MNLNITFDKIQKASEQIKTKDIQGKDYAEVNQRIKAFRMVFPDGFIRTELVSLDGGVAIFRAYVGYYEGEKETVKEIILGTGTAYEKEGSSFINKTSYIENCVPLDTQILTRDGWKFYYQLKEGEEVWSYNIETGKNEFCKLIRVNTYKDHPVVQMSTRKFKVTCTPEHKWLVRSQYYPIKKVATKDLTVSQKIVTGVRQDVEPSEIGKKLGWLMCDCDSLYTKAGMISTSHISQSKHVEEVTKLFGEGVKKKKYREHWMDNYEWTVPAEEARAILGQFGMATYKDLPKAMAEASLEDVAGCYESMMLADGDKRGFSSTYLELVEAVQIICARLGISTTFITSRMLSNATKPIYTIGIKKTDGAYYSEMQVKALPPVDVWCPTTENGTWCMRQGSFVTMTSNCETSAVGRALGMCGFGIDLSVASAEEVQNAMLNQLKEQYPEAKEEPKKATAKQIEVLMKVYTGANLDKLLQVNGIEKIGDLPMTKASELIAKLAKKEESANG